MVRQAVWILAFASMTKAGRRGRSLTCPALCKTQVFIESRHKQLTRLSYACYDSRAFSQISEDALFSPNEYSKRKALQMKGLSLYCHRRYLCTSSLAKAPRQSAIAPWISAFAGMTRSGIDKNGSSICRARSLTFHGFRRTCLL